MALALRFLHHPADRPRFEAVLRDTLAHLDAAVDRAVARDLAVGTSVLVALREGDRLVVKVTSHAAYLAEVDARGADGIRDLCAVPVARDHVRLFYTELGAPENSAIVDVPIRAVRGDASRPSN